jgi:hypothetical protein
LDMCTWACYPCSDCASDHNYIGGDHTYQGSGNEPYCVMTKLCKFMGKTYQLGDTTSPRPLQIDAQFDPTVLGLSYDRTANMGAANLWPCTPEGAITSYCATVNVP